MTTKVNITIEQQHMPVVVESNGRQLSILQKVGDSYSEYVHSGQQLTVREMTTAELHANDPK